MKRFFKFCGSASLLINLFVGIGFSPNIRAAGDEELTNKSIIELTQLGLGEKIVIEKIKSTQCKFDLSVDGLKQLKSANVPEDVIAVMFSASKNGKAQSPQGSEPSVAAGDLNDPAAPHEAGIWILEDVAGKPKMTKLEPSVYSQSRMGSTFGAGFGVPIKQQAVLRGSTSQMQTTVRRPTFYFYFERTNSGLTETQNSATSPNEYILAEFEVVGKENQRRLVVGSYNLYSGGDSGAEAKAVRHFDFEKVLPGVFKVIPKKDLGNGEYGFFYGGNQAGAPVGFLGGGTGGGKVFDFRINGSPETEPVREDPEKKPKKKSSK